MGFSWTQDISVGASIDSADIVEIRNNVDTVDDQKCATHYSSVCSGVDSSAQVTYYNNQDAGHYSGVYVSQDSGYHGAYQSSALSSQNVTYGSCAGYDSFYYNGHQAIYYYTY